MSEEYVLQRMISESGDSEVFIARHTVSSERFLLKSIKHGGQIDLRKRFYREINIVSSMDHPNIARPIDVIAEKKSLVIVYPFERGFTLAELIGKKNTFDEQEYFHIIIKLLNALAYIHLRGIIHADINPNNIFITDSNEVKLLDFGLSMPADEANKISEGRIIGTFPYLSPEQMGFTGFKIDTRTDLYCTAIILYQMVSGNLPFPLHEKSIKDLLTATLKREVPGIMNAPQMLNEILLKGLRPTPAERYQTAEGMLFDITVAAEKRNGRSGTEAAIGIRDAISAINRKRHFVFRNREIEILSIAAVKLPQKKGTSFLVYGKSGMGKTELLREFRNSIDETTIDYLQVKCNRFTSSQPYSTFRQMVVELILKVNSCGPDEKEAFRREFRASTAPFSGIYCEIIPEIRGWYDKVEDAGVVEAEKEPDRIIHALTSLVAMLCNVRDLIIVIDDFQWSDKVSAKLLLQVVEQQMPCMVVCNYRAVCDDAELILFGIDLKKWHFTGYLPIKCFTRSETEYFFRSRFDLKEHSDEIIECLFTRTAGAPYELSEALRYLVNNGIIRRCSGGWTVATSELEQLPEKLDMASLVLDKFHKLASAEKQFLQAAALMEGSFEPALVGVLLNLQSDQITEIGAALEADGFIIAMVNGRFSFFHDRLQELIALELPEQERTGYYEHLGRIYEARATEDKACILSAAEYYLKSWNAHKAIKVCFIAAKYAIEKKTFDIAIRYFKHCTFLHEGIYKKHGDSGVDIIAVNMLFGDVLALTGANEQALKIFAMTRSSDRLTAAQKLEIQFKIGSLYNNIGEFEKSSLCFIQSLACIGIRIPKQRFLLGVMIFLEICKSAVVPKWLYGVWRRSKRKQNILVVKILNKLSHSLYFCDMVKAYYTHFKSLNISKMLDDCSEKADTFNIHQIGLYQIGLRKKAFAYLRRTIRIATAVKRKDTLAFSHSGGGVIHYYSAQWKEAEKFLTTSMQMYDDLGDINNQIVSAEHLWKVLFLKGNIPVMREAMEHTIGLCNKVNERYYIAVTLAARNLIALLQNGIHDENEYVEILYRLQKVNSILFHIEAGGYLLNTEIECGKYRQAYERARRLLPLTLKKCINSEYQVRGFYLFSNLLVKELLRRRQGIVEIDASSSKLKRQFCVNSFIHWFSSLNYPAYRGAFHRNIAWFFALHNMKWLAHRSFKRAIMEHHKLDMRYEEACSLRDYGRFLDDFCGRPGEARDRYSAAYGIFEWCGAKLETNRLEVVLNPDRRQESVNRDIGSTRAGSDTTSSSINQLRFETLVDVSKTITETDDSGILLRQILSAMITATGAQYGCLFINKNAYEQFEPIAMSFEGNEVAVSEVPVFRDLIDKVNEIHTLQCTGEDDLDDDNETDSSYIRSDLCVPLNWRDKYLGYIYLVNDRVRGLFGEGAQKSAMILAAHAGILLENAALMGRQKQFTVELQQQVDTQTADIKYKHEQLEAANLKLIESERMKGILSGTLVHDIKNYAAGITGNLIYLDRRLENDPKAHRIIDVVVETCTDITSLASNLLDIAKMDDGKMIVREELLDYEFFEAMAEKFGKSTLFEEKGIVPTIIAPDPGFYVNADIYLLERVLQNLYSNASKYAPKGSSVELRLYQEGEECIVCFFNSGTPIPDSEKVILFEKYARIQNRQSPYSKGLGLFFCRMVMNAHGGRIWLDTDRQGNYFKLSFPRQQQYRRLSAAS